MASQVEQIKWIQGTRFMVDGFRFQNSRCQNYFLTHFHSDHTTGLTRNFTAGLIYCSPVTAVLLKKDMGMTPEHIVPLLLDTPISIDGITVTPIDANHCPGAVMFLFHVPAKHGCPSQLILHTGDLRWHSGMADHPAIKDKPLDVLYLDTTYAMPKHVHPHQDVAIAQIIDVMSKSVKEEPRTLFVVGAYHIGKERAFLGAAKALQWPVWVNPAKMRVLGMLDLPAADLELLTTQEDKARIHVVFMGQGLLPDALEKRMNASGNWARVVAFRPTGWSYRKNGLEVRRQGPVTIYGVPYSEHSSFPELRDCVKLLRPKRLVPTVNAGNPTASRRVADRFADLMDLSGDRSRLDMYFAGLQQRVASRSPLQALNQPPASLQLSPRQSGLATASAHSENLGTYGQCTPSLIKAESSPLMGPDSLDESSPLPDDSRAKGLSLSKAESSPPQLGASSTPEASHVARSAAIKQEDAKQHADSSWQVSRPRASPSHDTTADTLADKPAPGMQQHSCSETAKPCGQESAACDGAEDSDAQLPNRVVGHTMEPGAASMTARCHVDGQRVTKLRAGAAQSGQFCGHSRTYSTTAQPQIQHEADQIGHGISHGISSMQPAARCQDSHGAGPPLARLENNGDLQMRHAKRRRVSEDSASPQPSPSLSRRDAPQLQSSLDDAAPRVQRPTVISCPAKDTVETPEKRLRHFKVHTSGCSKPEATSHMCDASNKNDPSGVCIPQEPDVSREQRQQQQQQLVCHSQMMHQPRLFRSHEMAAAADIALTAPDHPGMQQATTGVHPPSSNEILEDQGLAELIASTSGARPDCSEQPEGRVASCLGPLAEERQASHSGILSEMLPKPDTPTGAAGGACSDHTSAFVDISQIDVGRQARLLAAIHRDGLQRGMSQDCRKASPSSCGQAGLMKQAKMQAFFRSKSGS